MNDSPAAIIFNIDGYEVAFTDAHSVVAQSAGLVFSGSDGSNFRFISVDATGKIRVTDGGGSLTVDSPQLPAVLVGGRLDTNIGAWLGSTVPTVGQKTSANSIPVVISSDQSTLSIGGTVTADQGAANSLANAWPIEITDGTDILGTALHPVRTDPTGTTTQPVSDAGGSLTIDTLQLPAALVGGRLDENIGSWLGSTVPTVGQKTMANSIPVVLSSDQSTLPVSGTITANQGTAAALGGAWPVEITDGTNVLGTNTHPVRTDPTGTTTQPVSDGGGSITVDGTVSVSNFPSVQPVSDNGGSLTVDDGGGSITIDGSVSVSNFPATQPVSGTVTANQGTPNSIGNSWPVEVTDGTNILGTTSHPVRTDPTGTTTQPVSDAGGSLTVDTPQLPSALVGGRLDENVGAWMGSTAPTVGQKTSANSLPVTIASDQSAVSISGTVNQGSPNSIANSWPVEVTDGYNILGTVTHPVRTDPTGTTTQPVSDGGGSLTVDTPQLPSALVGGRLDENVGAWLGSTAPTVGQKTMANSVPVVLPSDQSSITVVSPQLPASLGQTTMSGSLPVTMASNQASFPVEIEDLPLQHIDSFHRLRTSEPETLFDSKQVFDQQLLFWLHRLVGTGAQTYQAARASTQLSVSHIGDSAIRQTKRYFNYQPGKALSHGEPVLTLSGWVNIEDISVGDKVFDGLGNITEVVGKYPQGLRQIYRITFDDGTHVDCDGEHLWKTIIRQNSQKGEVRVLTTLQMLEEYGEEPPSFARWRIPAAPVLEIQEQSVPIDPYTFGAILGDGHICKNDSVQFTSADKEVVDNLKANITKHSSEYAYGILGLAPHIRDLGLSGKIAYDKFIPNIYKYNSKNVRLDVLQGLMDTDGTVDKHDGTSTYTSVSRQLADDVAFLVRSLGGIAKIKSRYTKYTNSNGDRVQGALSYRVSVIMPECPFKLERKAFYWKPRTRTSFDRYVHSIKPLKENLATCIRVSSDDHTFLTRNHIVTHNSHLIYMTFVMGAAVSGVTKRCGYFDGYNGIFLEQNGTTDVALVLRSNVSGSVVDTRITQNSWNLNKFDGYIGTAPDSDHEKTEVLDLSKAQILVIDFSWLGVGSVRVGFATPIGYMYAHNFGNPNTTTSVYMSSPNLPVRYEITSTSNNSATLEAICASVVSEGGQQQLGVVFAADRGITTASITNAAVRTIVGIRLQAGKTRRTIKPIGLTVYPVQGGSVYWCLMFNPVRGAGTAASWVNLTNSSIQYDVTSTEILTTDSNSVILLSGYVVGTSVLDLRDIPNQLLIGANDFDGLDPDELVLGARATGGGETVLGSLSWVEL